jgi:glyoxylase-like metal-dependent hydrolase (beta-lactamase superfamily II)
MIVMVEGKSGPVLLTSDAVHYYVEVENDWPFIIATDLPEFYLALDTVRELSEKPGVAYVAGHDPEVMNRFPPIDPSNPSLGVRVS